MKRKGKLEEIKKMYKDVGYHKDFFCLFILIVVACLVEVITVPYLVKQILDVEIPQQNIKGLVFLVSVHISMMLIQGYVVLKHCKMRCFLERWIRRDLRNRIFEKLQKVKATFFNENETGTILQLLQDDSQKASKFFPITITEMFIMGLMRFFVISIFLLFVNLKIGLLILGLYVVGLFVTLFFNSKTMIKIGKIRNINKEVYTTINEGIESFLTIKTLGIIKQKIRNLEKQLDEYNIEKLKLEKIVNVYNIIFSFIISLTSIVIIYFGSINVLQGIMTYAEIMLMIDYSKYMEFEFSWFIRHITDFNECFFACVKILELLEKEEEEDLEIGEQLQHKITCIEFDNVSFSYNHSQNNIKNFSLQVEKNQKIALIGKTGSGKTTIMSLLERLYEPQKGIIRINQKDYKEYNIVSLRNKIGYIPQKLQIVPGSILDNIQYVNKQITKDEVIRIFKLLKLHEKIISLPRGYQTNIYQNSEILSTGEKQIINFARIMAMDPDIIILDEVTSNLSCENEKLIKNAMDRVMEKRITFIIAHRLSTIEKCDKIIEIEKGEIISEKIP